MSEEFQIQFDEGIARLDGPAIYLPVRHHSPAASRLLLDCVARVRPKAILIEGPADFNSQFSELHREHILPIAIYSYVHFDDNARSGAFYPFCEYSPEWQAIKAAREAEIPAEFIDLPWAELAGARDQPAHRYADGEERRSNYFQTLTRRLGLEDYDDLWDQLFEVDPELTLDRYLTEFHRLLFYARLTNPGSEEDRRREDYMAVRIQNAIVEYGGPVVVVTGGFHSYRLYCILRGLPFPEVTQNAIVPHKDEGGDPPRQVVEQGIALTPYSYERLDSLMGYDAGLQNPGFYHRAWALRKNVTVERGSVYRSLLASVAATLREKKQGISTADLIASEALIRALATLRGHARPWRRDLVDGVRGALVKDDLGPGGWHPILEAVHAALRGDLRGRLASGTALPPLVADIHRQSERYDVAPKPVKRGVRLDLTNREDLPRARVLHQLAELGIAGYRLAAGGAVERRDDVTQVIEAWEIQQAAGYDATCIEASIYGPSLAEASRAKLEEIAGQVERSAAVAAQILLRASLMGHFGLADRFQQRLGQLIREDGEFGSVTAAVNTLLYLYRYDDVLGASRQAAAAALLKEAYDRGLWLAEALAPVSQLQTDPCDGIKLLRETLERCGPALNLLRDEFIEVFSRIATSAISANLRGSAVGALWSLAAIDASTIALPLTANPEELGDFLTGLFRLAKDAIERHPDLVHQVNAMVAGFDDEQFLVALPPLRLAFTAFTPREKDYIAAALFGRVRKVELAISPAAAAEVLAWEGRLFREMERYGVKR